MDLAASPDDIAGIMPIAATLEALFRVVGPQQLGARRAGLAAFVFIERVVNPLARISKTLLPQSQIDHPATSNVLARFSAMTEDCFVTTTGSLKCIGQVWHLIEGTCVIHALGKPHDAQRLPGRIEGDGLERVADDVTEVTTLLSPSGGTVCSATRRCDGMMPNGR